MKGHNDKIRPGALVRDTAKETAASEGRKCHTLVVVVYASHIQGCESHARPRPAPLIGEQLCLFGDFPGEGVSWVKLGCLCAC